MLISDRILTPPSKRAAQILSAIAGDTRNQQNLSRRADCRPKELASDPRWACVAPKTQRSRQAKERGKYRKDVDQGDPASPKTRSPKIAG